MRYFILHQDQGYTNIPSPVRWFQKLGPGDAMKSIQKFPDREIFMIETGEAPLFIDIMTEPAVRRRRRVRKS